MESLKIDKLKLKKQHFSFRLTTDERAAIEKYCEENEISFTNFFRVALRKMIK